MHVDDVMPMYLDSILIVCTDAGRAPGRQQAEALRGVQVVFCAGAPADEGGSGSREQQQQHGCDSSRGQGGSGPAEQPHHNLRGRRSTPAGAKAQRRSSALAAASGGVERSEACDSAAGAEPAPAPADSSGATGGAGRVAAAGHAADAAPAGGVDMSGAVHLAEALSKARPQGEPPVAIGTLTVVPDGEYSACFLQCPSSLQIWLLLWQF